MCSIKLSTRPNTWPVTTRTINPTPHTTATTGNHSDATNQPPTDVTHQGPPCMHCGNNHRSKPHPPQRQTVEETDWIRSRCRLVLDTRPPTGLRRLKGQPTPSPVRVGMSAASPQESRKPRCRTSTHHWSPSLACRIRSSVSAAPPRRISPASSRPHLEQSFTVPSLSSLGRCRQTRSTQLTPLQSGFTEPCLNKNLNPFDWILFWARTHQQHLWPE